MIFFLVVFRTSAKLGVAGGTVYYTASNGLWGSAEESAAFLRQQLAKSKISPATIDKLGEKVRHLMVTKILVLAKAS